MVLSDQPIKKGWIQVPIVLMQQEWDLSPRETLLPTQFTCSTYLKHFAEDVQIQIPGSHPSSQSVDYPTVGSMSLLLVTKHHVQSSQQQPNLIGLIR
jgi:hypothetical protein